MQRHSACQVDGRDSTNKTTSDCNLADDRYCAGGATTDAAENSCGNMDTSQSMYHGHWTSLAIDKTKEKCHESRTGRSTDNVKVLLYFLYIVGFSQFLALLQPTATPS